MKAYETTVTVAAEGELRVPGVPFSPGTEVRVIVSPIRARAEEFCQAWDRMCRELRRLPHLQSITDAEIQQEADAYRAGR